MFELLDPRRDEDARKRIVLALVCGAGEVLAGLILLVAGKTGAGWALLGVGAGAIFGAVLKARANRKRKNSPRAFLSEAS